MMRDEKTWDIKDAIEELEKEVESLDGVITVHQSQVDRFTDKRNSLSIGLCILKKLYEEKSELDPKVEKVS